MVRIGALDMLESVPANQIWPLASPLLSDPSCGVRIRAASLLAAVPTANQPAADREQFERAAAEFIAAQRFNADRPESAPALGSFFAKRGRPIEAEAEYKAALRLSPQYAPAASQPCRSLPTARAGGGRRECAAGRACCFSARCGPSPRARSDAGAAKTSRRCACRIAPCR